MALRAYKSIWLITYITYKALNILWMYQVIQRYLYNAQFLSVYAWIRLTSVFIENMHLMLERFDNIILCSQKHAYMAWLGSVQIGLKSCRVHTSHRSVIQPGNLSIQCTLFAKPIRTILLSAEMEPFLCCYLLLWFTCAKW